MPSVLRIAFLIDEWLFYAKHKTYVARAYRLDECLQGDRWEVIPTCAHEEPKHTSECITHILQRQRESIYRV